MKETLKCLIKAYLGECQARNRYTYYAKVAQKEGFEQIGEIFLVTADQEKIHAKRLFEHIQELKKELPEDERSEIMMEGVACPTVFETTLENLQAAINGEHYENSKMYPEFAQIANKEGYPKIAGRFLSICKAEEHHEERYKKLHDQVKNKTFFKKNEQVWWVCRKCGYAFFGKEPPENCPSCDHPKAFYERKCEEY